MASSGFDNLTQKKTYRVIFWIVCILLVGANLIAFVRNEPEKHTGINGWYPCMFGEMVKGTAYKPFVYRRMVPTTIRIITFFVPASLKDRIDNSIGKSPKVRGHLDNWKLNWEAKYFTEYLIALVVLYFSLFAFILAFRFLLTAVYKAPRLFMDAATIIVLLSLPPCYYRTFLYDYMTLFLFTLALALMVRRKWILFSLVYCLGCLNKETTILLTAIFAIHFFRKSGINRHFYFGHIVFQVGFLVLVKITLMLIYWNNPSPVYGVGGFLEWHFFEHLRYSLVPFPISTLVAWGVIFALVVRKWNEKPKFLKDGLWTLVPLLLIGLMFSFWYELRAYYEAFPIVMLLVCHSLADLTGIEIVSRDKLPVAAAATE
ncbi:MAG: hypothetical protein ACYS8W_08350 [Planctomycetota bacterium]|jgi:hypothetical protein